MSQTTVHGRGGAEEGRRRRQEGAVSALISNRQRLACVEGGNKERREAKNRASPSSRAVFLQRRAELKRRLSSLSVDVGVANAMRSTSREGKGMLLRSVERRKKGERGVKSPSPSNECQRRRAAERARATSLLPAAAAVSLSRHLQTTALHHAIIEHCSTEKTYLARQNERAAEKVKGGWAVEGGEDEKRRFQFVSLCQFFFFSLSFVLGRRRPSNGPHYFSRSVPFSVPHTLFTPSFRQAPSSRTQTLPTLPLSLSRKQSREKHAKSRVGAKRLRKEKRRLQSERRPQRRRRRPLFLLLSFVL